MKPRFNVQQKLTAFTNMYRVFETNEALEPTQLKAFAQQKKLAMKEQITFYSDEQKTKPTFSFRAEKVLDVHGRFFVEDSDGTRIGMFKKEFTKSLTNSTWQVMDADGKPLFIVKESNEFLALARRMVGIIPIFGELLEMALFFINYHFVFIDSETNEIVGKYQKTTMFRDHYLLYMTDDGFAKVDWRVFASMGVALDALQSR